MHVGPPVSFCKLCFQGLHDKGLFLGGTNIGTVAAAGAVKYTYLDLELMALGVSNTLFCNSTFRRCCQLLVSQEEGSDCGVRTYI